MDVLSPEQRQLNMSRIRGKDTKPEMMLRRGLHQAGLRFRLHARELPGRPDLIFPRYHAAVLIHGCFWHGHDCPMFKLPRTRTEFWTGKIAGNRARDRQNEAALSRQGWRIMTVWECALKGPARLRPSDVIAACNDFIRGSSPQVELKSHRPEVGRPQTPSSSI
jgi:DNA mismatch endonuclease (patch repair protein)